MKLIPIAIVFLALTAVHVVVSCIADRNRDVRPRSGRVDKADVFTIGQYVDRDA